MNRAGSGGSTPADVRIERLSLRVAGLDEDAARRLARLVAEGLAAGEFRSPPMAGLNWLSVPVTADTARPDVLAQRIAAEISRAMEREAP